MCRPKTGVSAGALTATLAACDVDMAVRRRAAPGEKSEARLTAKVALTPTAQASVDLAYALTLEKDLYNRKGGLAGAPPAPSSALHSRLVDAPRQACGAR